MILGYALLTVSLVSDGVLSLKEEVLKSEIKKEDSAFLPFEFMQLFNLISLVFICVHLGIVFSSGELKICLDMLIQNPDLLLVLGKYSLLTAIGQVTVFFILSEYGPLNLSVITTVRKILSVIVSVVLFNKKLESVQYIAIGLTFLMILFEIYVKLTKSKAKVQ